MGRIQFGSKITLAAGWQLWGCKFGRNMTFLSRSKVMTA